MTKRWLLLLAMLAVASLFLLWRGHWLGFDSTHIVPIHIAQRTMAMPGVATAPSSPVNLPDVWSDENQVSGAVAYYQIILAPTQDTADWSIMLSNHLPGLRIKVDGVPASFRPLYGRWDQVVLVSVGSIAAGKTVELVVPQFFNVQSGLDAVQAGPTASLERKAKILSLMHTVNRLLPSGMTLGFSLVIAVTLFFRRDLLLVLLGYLAIAAFVRQVQLGVLGMWEGDDAAFATYLFATSNAVVALSLLMLRAAQQKLEGPLRLAMACIPVLGLVLYNQLGSLELRRSINFMVAIGFFTAALYSSLPTILRKRQWILLVVVFAVILRMSFIGYELFAHDGRFDFYVFNDPVGLAPVMVIALSIALARHAQQAFRNYEMTNISLQEQLDIYKEKLNASIAREKSLAVQKAAETERTHWLQEIHDGIGSQLIAARIVIDKLPEQPKLASAKFSIDDAIEQLRMMVESLAPIATTVPSLLGALRYRVAPRFEAAGIALRWKVDPMIHASEITAKQALNVQRIVQEALSNVLKHAQATTVLMEISTQDGWMVVRIEDDGIGLQNASVPQGHGMINMKNRAKACDGEIRWTQLIKGTQVELRLPNGSWASSHNLLS